MPQRFIADDFAAIRARMEELRRVEGDANAPTSPSPAPAAKLSRVLSNPRTPPSVRRLLERRGFRPRMISDLDILRTAALLIQQHGDNAPVVALERHGEMLMREDHEGAGVWARIRRVVAELQVRSRGSLH